MYSIDDLLEQPYMNIDKPASRVSDKYSFVPTRALVDRCLDAKLIPTSYPRTDNPYGRHVITMKSAEVISGNVGDLQPMITIDNSANGLSKLSVHGGLFRLVCSNGMVVPYSKDSAVSLVTKHKGLDPDWINEVLQSAINAGVTGGSVAERWKGINLSDSNVLQYADHVLSKEPISGRFYSKSKWTPADVDNMLARLRPEDEDNDLWTTFNVVQEKLINGGFNILKDSGKVRQVKPINNLLRRKMLNLQLWEATEEFAGAM